MSVEQCFAPTTTNVCRALEHARPLSRPTLLSQHTNAISISHLSLLFLSIYWPCLTPPPFFHSSQEDEYMAPSSLGGDSLYEDLEVARGRGRRESVDGMHFEPCLCTQYYRWSFLMSFTSSFSYTCLAWPVPPHTHALACPSATPWHLYVSPSL